MASTVAEAKGGPEERRDTVINIASDAAGAVGGVVQTTFKVFCPFLAGKSGNWGITTVLTIGFISGGVLIYPFEQYVGGGALMLASALGVTLAKQVRDLTGLNRSVDEFQRENTRLSASILEHQREVDRLKVQVDGLKGIATRFGDSAARLESSNQVLEVGQTKLFRDLMRLGLRLRQLKKANAQLGENALRLQGTTEALAETRARLDDAESRVEAATKRMMAALDLSETQKAEWKLFKWIEVHHPEIARAAAEAAAKME